MTLNEGESLVPSVKLAGGALGTREGEMTDMHFISGYRHAHGPFRRQRVEIQPCASSPVHKMG